MQINASPARAAARGTVRSLGRAPAWPSCSALHTTDRLAITARLGRCACLTGSLLPHSELTSSMHEVAMLMLATWRLMPGCSASQRLSQYGIVSSTPGEL